MAVFKCKMCGGDLDLQEGVTVCECEYCGSKQTVPNADNEKKMTMLSRANKLRLACEFDKASLIFENIVLDYPKESEAYWGLVLCKYGIEYIDDPITKKKVPTCHRTSFDSVLDDSDYELAVQNADSISRRVYIDEAKAIEDIRLKIADISSKEDPYDVFISYKDKDASGSRTQDSVMAQEVYEKLTSNGLKVFFSRITLMDKIGREYEPYIYSAIQSSRVMLVFGSKPDYFSDAWIKNEWSRFLDLIEQGKEKVIIPCFIGMEPEDMPTALLPLQAQDMQRIGAVQDLSFGVMKLLGYNQPQPTTTSGTVPAASGGSALSTRGYISLEDGEYSKAINFFERALDSNPSDGSAYLGKFLAYRSISSIESLGTSIVYFDESKEFRHAEQFADAQLRRKLAIARENNEKNLKRKMLAYASVINAPDAGYNQAKAALGDLITEECPDRYVSDVRRGRSGVSGCAQNSGNAVLIRLLDQLQVVKAIAAILKDDELYNLKSIQNAVSRACNSDLALLTQKSLDELTEYTLIDRISNSSSVDHYCLPGAKKRSEERRLEAERKRKLREQAERQHKAACEEIEAKIQAELLIASKPFHESYDPRIDQLRKELGAKQAVLMNDKLQIQYELTRLKESLSSLGFFDKDRKNYVNNQIAATTARLDNIEAQANMASENYGKQIQFLEHEMQSSIEAAEKTIRAKYELPKLEDFLNAE